jgi:PAS domain S-box-containing protein
LIFIFLGSFLFVLVLIILFLKLTLKRKKISLALFKKQVQKSEKRFTELFETMGSAVIFQNKNMEVILANKQAEKLFGFSFKTLKNTQRNIFQNAVTEDGFKITEQNNPFFSVLKNGKKINSLVVGLKNPDLINNLKWILINATPESDEISNDYQGVLFVMEDITEMKIMEEELIKRNTELEQIFDTVPDAMIYADKNRNILKVNKSFTRIFHYLPKEVKNKNTSFLYNNFEDYKIQGQIRYTKDSPKITLPYELEYKKKSSDVFTGETIGSRLTDPKGNTLGILILIRDVTEKRKLETIINRTQKIESIGRIAGSIAHDFNNILTVISGYSDLIDIKSSKLPDINSQAVQIKNAVSKAQKLTRHLLTFSRKQTLNFSKTDINQLIKNFRDFLYPVLGKNISLYLNFSEPVCNVKADSGQIEQILMNLAVNSKDAFKEKGKITISTMKKTINFSDKPLINLPPGKYALIKFEDNGPGIPKEVMEHIFEPFFTTKTKEKGTGLGLSTVYGITKLHGGEVTVSSFPGSGTVFSIYLPCFDN